MAEKSEQGSVTLTREEYDALISGLAHVSEREMTERLDIASANPALNGIQAAINTLIDDLDKVLEDDRESTMNMALSMSECFAVLDSVRQFGPLM